MKLFHRIAITTLGVVLASSTVAGIALINRRDTKIAKAADMYEYNLYSGSLTAGEYVIYYNGKAMKNTTSSNRLTYEEVSPVSNKITTDNAAIVWTLAASGDYWTIYSAAVSKYAAGTGTKNQAGLLASGTDDKSLWKVTGTSTYDFENKAHKAASINAMLRNNGTYGFACYAAGTGGALSLYKKGNKVTNVPATGVAITADKTNLDYGEELQLTATVTPNDATDKRVSWTSSNPSAVSVDAGKVLAVGEGTSTITATALGGESVTDTVNITSSLDDSYAYADVLNRSTFGVTNNNYTSWNNKSASNTSHSTTIYQGNTNGANESIGIKDETGFGFVVSSPYGIAKKVSLSWNSNTTSGRTLNIIGSNSAIELATMSKSDATVATIVEGTSTEAVLGEGYRYLGFISSNGSLFLNSMVIYWDANLVPTLDLSGDSHIVLGDTATFTATRLNSSDSIKWYINDALVETGISVVGNTSTLTYTPSAAGDYEIKAILGDDVCEETMTLNTIAKNLFEKVTSISELTNGSKVILVGSKKIETVDHFYVADKFISGDYLNSTEARFESEDIVALHTTAIFEVNYVTDEGYTFSYDGKYLDATGGTKNNQLKVTASPTAQYWNINFDSESNLLTNANVAETDNEFRGYARFNTTSLGFSCYVSATQNPIQLYKLKTAAPYYAEDFASDLLDLTDAICDAADHGNSALLSPIWTNLKTNKFVLLDSDNVLALKNADADESGDIIEQAMARYDHICKAYSFENFLNRASANHLNHLSLFNNNNGSNVTLVIVVTSIITAVSLAGVFFIIRKRKHQ